MSSRRTQDYNVNDLVYFHHKNKYIYKAKVIKKTKTKLVVKTLDTGKEIEFNLNDEYDLTKSGFLFDITEVEYKNNNRLARRFYENKELQFIGDELCFNNVPINELSSVERGNLEDYLYDIPTSVDIEVLKTHEEGYDELADLHETLTNMSKKDFKQWIEAQRETDKESVLDIVLRKFGEIIHNYDFEG